MEQKISKIILEVRAGTGGEEAALFAGDLARMYQKFAAKNGWRFLVLDSNQTSLRGFKTFIAEISNPSPPTGGSGQNLYEILKGESGVHRLVRISPFDAKKLRHTSFALVEVLPELPEADASKIQIPEKDLKIEFSRSSGPGGQNVNKVETAVRVHHLPTGLTVSSQAERSQSANRECALRLLKAKLVKLMEEKHEKELSNLRVKVSPEWAHEIRSYVLHPYKQVKDHRTGKKISRVEEVLEGNLDLLKSPRG